MFDFFKKKISEAINTIKSAFQKKEDPVILPTLNGVDQDDFVDKLNDCIDSFSETIDELNDELSEATDCLNDEAKEIEALNKSIDKIREKMKRSDIESRHEFRDEIADLKEERAEHERYYDDYLKNAEALKNKISRYQLLIEKANDCIRRIEMGGDLELINKEIETFNQSITDVGENVCKAESTTSKSEYNPTSDNCEEGTPAAGTKDFKFCPYCGKKIGEFSKFCPFCGKPQPNI